MTTDAGQGYGEQRALVVDDDDFMRKMLVRITSALGFKEVAGVGSGAEALVLLADAAAQADLLLLDINMPGMDGYEVLAVLQREPLTRHTPVVAITANALARDIERGRAAGFLDYVTKPIDVAAFLRVVEEALENQRLPRSK